MRALAVFAAAVFAPSLVAAPVPKEKAKRDDEAIVGSWAIDTFDAGREKPPTDISKFRFVFAEKGAFKMTGGPLDKTEGTFKLDAEATPKTLDIVLDGRAMKALYELDDDTLKLCIPNGEKDPRPAEMKADANKRIALVTFKREKGEKKDK